MNQPLATEYHAFHQANAAYEAAVTAWEHAIDEAYRLGLEGDAWLAAVRPYRAAKMAAMADLTRAMDALDDARRALRAGQ
jgi:hypothetical protein